MVNNISNRSPTSSTCYRQKLSPMYVTTIDVANISSLRDMTSPWPNPYLISFNPSPKPLHKGIIRIPTKQFQNRFLLINSIVVLFPTKVFFTESLNLAKLRKKSGLLESQLLLGKSMRETEDTWKHFKSKERQLECIERQLKTEELIVSTKVIYR